MTKRNFMLWFPMRAIAAVSLPIKRRPTSLELFLRVV